MIQTIPDAASPFDLNLFTQVLQHNWYAVAVLVVMLATQYVKVHRSEVWAKFPVGWRFGFPALAAMAAAFVHAFAAGEPWKQAGLDVLNSLWQIALPAMGGAAALKESPLPWSGGSGGAPKLAPADPAPAPPPSNVVQLPLAAEDDRLTPVDGSLPPSDPPPAA